MKSFMDVVKENGPLEEILKDPIDVMGCSLEFKPQFLLVNLNFPENFPLKHLLETTSLTHLTSPSNVIYEILDWGMCEKVCKNCDYGAKIGEGYYCLNQEVFENLPKRY
jgi:hypothetical protein